MADRVEDVLRWLDSEAMNSGFVRHIANDAAIIIREQREEIERLKAERADLYRKIAALHDENAGLRERAALSPTVHEKGERDA